VKIQWLDSSELYDGAQLRSLFAYMKLGVQGDSAVAWRGPCAVAWDHMVDGEDLRAQSPIAGADMVHVIAEMFDCRLITAVALQRLLASLTLELLRERAGNQTLAQKLTRSGDDLFADSRKLSISIATVSPVSALVHFAVNVTNEGTPVPTLALTDLQIEPQKFAQALLERFKEELDSIKGATQKVNWVK
jgi:hypothetical protein